MKMNKGMYLVAALFAGAIVLAGSLFIVDEREYAIVMQFGEAKRAIETPGLKMKIPFVQDIVRYDKRLLSYDVPEIEVTASDSKRININLLTRYVIKDPILFYKKLGSQRSAQERLSQIVPGAMRRVIGRIKLKDLFSNERGNTMDNIHKNVIEAAVKFGIDVRDVRIVAAEFPQENQNAIFRRMKTQQVQLANLYRAQGTNRANEIQATAERVSKEINSNAYKDGLLERGAADAEATVIYAKVHNRDPKFYEFWRSLEAYRVALKEKTKYIIPPTGKFFEYFSR